MKKVRRVEANSSTFNSLISTLLNTSVCLQVEDTVALIRHLKMEPAVFFGESSGARMSIRCALKHPSGRCVVLQDQACGFIVICNDGPFHLTIPRQGCHFCHGSDPTLVYT